MKLLRVLGRLGWLARAAWWSRKSVRAPSAEGRQQARRALAELFREARGATLKVGQIWSSLGLEGDPEAAVVHARARPLAELLPGLERVFARPWREVFRHIESTGLAASLGQVHRAELLDGRVVAVKIQYPEIAAAVAAELTLAGLVPAAGPVKRFGFDVAGYRRMLADTLGRELDYRSEAERQEHFRHHLGVQGLVVPTVNTQWSGPTVLVSTWEEGVPLAEFAGGSVTDHTLIGRALLLALFGGLFRVGEVHADPNGGNFLVRRDPAGRPEVVLLDFGCTLPLTETRRLALLKLVLACRETADVDPLATLVALGFDPQKLQPIAAELAAVCRALCAPFLVDRPFALDEWHLGECLAEALGELRWWFRAAASPDLLLLVRAFQGTVGHLARLDARLPWWPLLVHAAGEAQLARARAWVPPPLPAAVADRASTLAGGARLLQVAVTEGEREVVAVALPAAEVANLDEHIPQAVAVRLAAQGLDLPALVARIVRDGVRPQAVFDAVQGDRRYRVWLE